MLALMKYHLKNEKGFTLLELLVGVSLLSIVALIGLNLTYYALHTNSSIQSKIEAVNSVERVLNTILQSIRTAHSEDISINTESNGTSALNYKEKDKTTGNYQSCSYRLRNGIIEKVSGSNIYALTPASRITVTNLTFTQGSDNRIKVQLEIKFPDGKTFTSWSEATIRSNS